MSTSKHGKHGVTNELFLKKPINRWPQLWYSDHNRKIYRLYKTYPGIAGNPEVEAEP